MPGTSLSLKAGLFTLFAAAGLTPPACAGNRVWLHTVSQALPVYAGVVTGTPSAQACPQGGGLGDGCPMSSIGNGLGTVQHADFFPSAANTLSYATQISNYVSPTNGLAQTSRAAWPVGWRPSWNVAGVDYPVGVKAGTVLRDVIDNKALLPIGCQDFPTSAGYNGDPTPTHRIVCNGLVNGSDGNGGKASQNFTNLVLENWDFRTKSVALSVQNWRGTITLRNNRFGGRTVNTSSNLSAWVLLTLSNLPTDACVTDPAGCIQILNNDVDANVAGFQPVGSVTWASDMIGVNTGYTAKYNVFTNANSRFIITGSGHTPTLQNYCTIIYNYIEGFNNADNALNDYSNPTSIKLPLSQHGEVSLSGNCGHLFTEYNTMLQPVKNGVSNTYSGKPTPNDGDVSGFIYPYTGVFGPYCVRMTFSGNVGRVANTKADGTGTVFPKGNKTATYNVNTAPADQSSFCGEYQNGKSDSGVLTNATEDGNVRFGFSDDSRLYNLSTGTFLPGHVTAISTVTSDASTSATAEGTRTSSGPQPYSTFVPTGWIDAITMSQAPGDGTYNVYMTQKMPEVHIDHNVGVTNFWNSGSTEWGNMVGGFAQHYFGVLEIQNNWWDATGSYRCFQAYSNSPTTFGIGIGDAKARSDTVLMAGDVSLLRVGSTITYDNNGGTPSDLCLLNPGTPNGYAQWGSY